MKFRKKPVVIEAVQYTGSNLAEICKFMKKPYQQIYNTDGTLSIETLEGTMKANPFDYIIKGINGEFYPCKPGIFNKTYEPVEE